MWGGVCPLLGVAQYKHYEKNFSNTSSIPFSMTLDYQDWDLPSSWWGTDWRYSVCWYSAGSVEHQGNKHKTFTLFKLMQCHPDPSCTFHWHRAIQHMNHCNLHKPNLISHTRHSSHRTFIPVSQLHNVDVVIPDFIFELLTQWGRSWFFLLLLVSTRNNCWHWSAISSNIMASQC